MTQGATAFEGSNESVVTSLVALAVSGDPRAFDALADRIGDGLYRRAYTILRDEPDARDAAQEALIRAWRELPRLQTSGSFDAWLDRILVNVCRDQLRRRRRRQVREIRPVLEPTSSEWVGLPAADHGSRDDRTALIVAAFRRLSIDDRSLIVLHHLESRSVADLAVALRIPEGTVKRRLHTARERLQRALEQEER